MILLLFIYDIFFILTIILIYIPQHLLRRKFSLRAFLEKFPLLPQDYKGTRSSIWIQAVSVGEVFLIKKLINQLEALPNLRIVISTTTLTGHGLANRLYSWCADIIFFPFDISFVLKKVIKKIKPKVFVAIETEIWPNLFYQLKRYNIPIVILNGRISDGAYAKYKKIRFLIKSLLAIPTFIGVQNEFYKRRFLSLGAQSNKVFITGNMKFFSLEAEEEKVEYFKRRYVPLLKRKGQLLLIAASTHHPEEKMVLDIYTDLAKTGRLKLLIAPRHPERARDVGRLVRTYSFRPIMISKLNGDGLDYTRGVFVLDTIGDLFYFYSISDLCFVGGSLINYGGHNILEPLYFLKPTLFGPFMSNFREIEEIVLAYNAAIKVQDTNDLENKLSKLISDNDYRRQLSNNCFRVFADGEKYLNKNLEIVLKCLR